MAITSTWTGQSRDLGGGMTVRRLLPHARLPAVGPFVFFDHFGPLQKKPGMNTDVRPHPHIGLATVTYLWEGAMLHRDSLGTVQRIEPGAVNWMSAGRGIVHSERVPEDLVDVEHTAHGLQLGAALPRAQEDSPPAFSHLPADAVPTVAIRGVQVRVLAGEAWGVASPLALPSPTLCLDVLLQPGQALHVPALAEEMALYAVDSLLQVDGQPLAPRVMGLIEGDTRVSHASQASAPARLALIGGAPLDGPRLLWWNFVASERARIVQAAQAWDAHRFDTIVGDDDERIELPERRPL